MNEEVPDRGGRPRKPAGTHRVPLRTTVSPGTMAWLESAVARLECGQGQAVDRLVERIQEIERLARLDT